MTPYYEHAGITIYLGDCREVMPTLDPVDLVLTDPPYGVNKKYVNLSDSKQDLNNLLTTAIPMMFSKSSRLLITPGIGQIWKYPAADWVMCWNKPNAMTRSVVASANIWEPILVYGIRCVFGVDAITVAISPQKFDHPCPKPLRLFLWLVSRATTPQDTILDPFMGSGTTLVAAKQLGRKAIGIEIEEKYCEIAVRRLQQEVMDF